MFTASLKSRLAALGLLRQGVLGLALVNASLPLLHALAAPAAAAERSLWDLFATLISPVMAPLLAVVILFDYIMSRVRAADADGDERARYAGIARTELAVLALTLLVWVPFFADLLF